MTKVHGWETLFLSTGVVCTPTKGRAHQSTHQIGGIYFIDNMIFMLEIRLRNSGLERSACAI